MLLEYWNLLTVCSKMDCKLQPKAKTTLASLALNRGLRDCHASSLSPPIFALTFTTSQPIHPFQADTHVTKVLQNNEVSIARPQLPSTI